VKAAEEVVKLVAHRLERRLVEVALGVLADLLEHAGRLGQEARQRGEPL
jgi:hypothetical protein